MTLLVGASAQALPRYAARYEQNCNLCHTNPSGGGMRSLYATQFLTPKELAGNWLDFGEELTPPDPQLTENILIGADVRTLFIAGDQDDADPENFFQMQNDLYLEFSRGERFAIYMDRGQSSSLESFGIAHILPYSGYLKIGRFTPAFGWKFADHNRFVRSELGFAPPDHTDVGAEMGFHPGNGNVQLSMLNGAHGSILDDDESLAYAGRGEYRFRLRKVGFCVGANYYYLDEDDTGSTQTAGGFGYVTLGRLIYMGEMDWRERNRDSGDVRGFFSSQEFSYNVMPGFDAVLSWDFADPDVDLTSGARQRIGIGLDSLVSTMFGVRAMLFLHDEDRDGGGSEHDYEQFELLFHFLY